MDNSGVFVGLDIGSTQIKVIVGQRDGRGITAIGAATVPSRGMRNGVIVDIEQSAMSIRQAIDEVQYKSNIQINQVVVGVPASQLEIRPVQGVVTVSNQEKRIGFDDIFAVTQQALSQSLPQDREYVGFVANEFLVDGFDGIKDPLDMVGIRLEMKGTAYIGSRTIKENIRVAVQRAGLQVKQFVLTPLALGSTILNDGEKDFGTVIIDLGGGLSTVAVIHDNQLKLAYVDPEGGEFVTHDISEVLKTSMSNAEKLKRDYGYADPLQASDQEQILAESINGGQSKQISQRYLAEIIEAREEQIFTEIFNVLQNAKALDMPGGIVLTGGGAAMPRIADLTKRIFGKQVKLFIPDQIGLRHPAYTRSLAYSSFVAKQSATESVIVQALESINQQQFQQNAPAISNDYQMTANNNSPYNNQQYQNVNTQNGQPGQKLSDRVKNLIQNFFER